MHGPCPECGAAYDPWTGGCPHRGPLGIDDAGLVGAAGPYPPYQEIDPLEVCPPYVHEHGSGGGGVDPIMELWGAFSAFLIFAVTAGLILQALGLD